MNKVKIAGFGKLAALSATLISQNYFTQMEKDSLGFPVQAVTISRVYTQDKNGKKIRPQNSDFIDHDAGCFLNNIPEINGIRKSGNFATDPVLRGFKYEQLNIVIDGALNAINACPSRMDPVTSHVNMNMVEEAEIFKGPYNFRYGAALGGSINFVMKEPEFAEHFSAGGRLTTGYESNGNITKNELVAGLKSKYWAVDVFGSYQKGDSYKDAKGNLVPSSFLRYTLGSKSLVKWDDNNITSFQVNTNHGKDVEFAALRMDLIYDKTWMFQGKHMLKFQKALVEHLNFSVYYTTVEHSMGTPNRMMVSDVDSQTYGGRAELKLKKNKSLLFGGIDYKMEQAENTRMIMPENMPMRDGTAWQDAKIWQLGWFSEYQHAFDRSKLNLSYRMDFNNAMAGNPSQLFKKLYGNTQSAQINHNLSLGYSRHLGNYSVLSLWIGRSQRSGSISERFINRFVVGIDAYEMLGNPYIKPETNNQTDLIFTFKRNNLQLQGNGFFSYLQNYISGVINPNVPQYGVYSPGVRQYVNIKSAMKAGVEASASWNITPKYRTQWAIAYTYAKDWETHEPLPEVAPLDLRWNLFADFEPLFLVAKFRYVAVQNRINAHFGELRTPDFFTFDTEARYEVFKNTFVTIHGHNLLNRAYAEHLSRTLSMDKNQRILAPGRSLSLGFSYAF